MLRKATDEEYLEILMGPLYHYFCEYQNSDLPTFLYDNNEGSRFVYLLSKYEQSGKELYLVYWVTEDDMYPVARKEWAELLGRVKMFPVLDGGKNYIKEWTKE